MPKGAKFTKMFTSKLVIGKKYIWGAGASYLECTYIGKSTPELVNKCFTHCGKGYIFEIDGSTGKHYNEVGIQFIYNDISEIEIIQALCEKTITVKDKLNPHSYDMRYYAGHIYLFKCTDLGYECVSTENVTPISERKFNNNFKIRTNF